MINLKKLTEKLWSQSVHNFGAVIGEIRWFAMSTPPTGWLVCNGATVFTSNYAALFAAIGKTFTPRLTSTDPDVENPEYSDPTVFRLPNLIGKVPWGSTSVGTVLDAGLPNIKGELQGISRMDSAKGQGVLQWKYMNYGEATAGRSGPAARDIVFDASIASSIYGKSDTVQMKSIYCNIWQRIK